MKTAISVTPMANACLAIPIFDLSACRCIGLLYGDFYLNSFGA